MDAKEVSIKLDTLFHKSLASEWDNSGLLVDAGKKEVQRILLCIDVLQDILDTAVEKKVDLILCHHPLIFGPVKNILKDNALGSKIIQAIKNELSIYSAHTNYDLMAGGLSDYIMEKLDITLSKPLMPVGKKWFKYAVFVPVAHAEKIREVICKNNAGIIGNYSCCTFNTRGKGTFMPLSGSKSFIGEEDQLSIVDEIKIESIVDEENLDNLIKAVTDAHPYEEAAYDAYRIETSFHDSGFGRVGDFKKEITFHELDSIIKNVFQIKNFRFMHQKDKKINHMPIKKIAVLNGSASSLISLLKNDKIDAVIVGEIGYHQAIEIVENGKLLIEIGHLESEKLAIDNMHDKISKMFKEFGERINLLKADSGILGWRYSIEQSKL